MSNMNTNHSDENSRSQKNHDTGEPTSTDAATKKACQPDPTASMMWDIYQRILALPFNNETKESDPATDDR
jgi:hypothetical protein